jgi:2',3'-cyclic-nucleotide 2'-phosphodiesterase (5'-nucleotidase family)
MVFKMSFRESGVLTSCYRTALAICLLFIAASCTTPAGTPDAEDDVVTISIIGTNDVHGELLAQPGRGGLTTFSGYVDALRIARAKDDGGVLLIDAGDMWQGTLESNSTEGAPMVEAFNALGYAAAAVGNHEFDFGPVGSLSTPGSDADDARGALKQRARAANFPLLAANLIDIETDKPVDWDNVQPSVMVDVAGIKVGIIGVMASDALLATISANVVGLRVAPLADSIKREARLLRASGASLVIVTAHAGGRCNEFDDPMDSSSCQLSGEIFQVASDLPAGLVDHIIAGHTHTGIAQVVNGISITESFSNTRAFGRVDFTIDRRNLAIQSRHVFPPQRICRFVDTESDQCASPEDESASYVAASYEGQTIVPSEAVLAIAERAALRVGEIKAEELGPILPGAITLDGRPESALGNLMVDALLEMHDADIAFQNVSGGIRANLPAGKLTFGSVYQMFPFDNSVVILDMPGADLRRIIEKQVHNVGRRAGFSGMRVFVDCDDNHMSIAMLLADGREIQDDDNIRFLTNNFLALGGSGMLDPGMPDGGFQFSNDLPLIRDTLVQWFRMQDGQIDAEQFLDEENRRWNLPDPLPAGCSL